MQLRLTSFAARDRGRRALVRMPSLAAGVVGLALVMGGCAQTDAPPLPDLAAKKQAPSGAQPLSTAEQKKAIDALAAKRDAVAAEPKR